MQPAFLTPETFALTIPLLSIFGGISLAIVAMIMSGRKKELVHKERLIAIEKGIDLPDEPRKSKRESYLSNRTGGLVMSMIGLTLTIALWTVAGSVGGVWGLIPFGIGVGLLISSTLEKKEVEREKNDEQNV